MIEPNYRLELNWDDSWQMDRPHFHEDIEILLSLSAHGGFFIGNEVYPLQEGALFVLSDGTLHRSIARGPYKRYIMHISPDTLQELSTPQSDLAAFARIVEGRYKQLTKQQTAELEQKFQLLGQEQTAGFCGDIQRTVYLLDFLATVFRLLQTAGEGRKDNNADFERISPIIQYIQENIAEALTLDDLAARFFLNKFHMCHLFKAAIGFSVREYIIHCRVLKARKLLRQGYRVQEVGEMVGFKNNAHFIRTFGKLTGTSPKRYANQYRGKGS